MLQGKVQSLVTERMGLVLEAPVEAVFRTGESGQQRVGKGDRAGTIPGSEQPTFSGEGRGRQRRVE